MIKSVVIIGTGALATFYGTKWISIYRVSVLGTWEVSINALNKIDGIEAFLNWHSANEPDLVVWLTKTYKNEEALEKYSKLRWSCPILILQNGIGQKEHFRKTLGEQQKLFSGITTQGAKLIDPGKVVNTGNGDLIVEKARFLEGFPAIQDSNIDEALLKKLAINCVLNTVTALFNVKNGDAVKGEPLIKVKELVKLCFPYFEKRMIFTSEKEYLNFVNEVANKTSENINSMLSDLLSGRETEINQILGPIQVDIKSVELQNIISRIHKRSIVF